MRIHTFKVINFVIVLQVGANVLWTISQTLLNNLMMLTQLLKNHNEIEMFEGVMEVLWPKKQVFLFLNKLYDLVSSNMYF